ncbi:hypothetical protein ABTN41_19725, partial [Acinetobacter baumannii]
AMPCQLVKNHDSSLKSENSQHLPQSRCFAFERAETDFAIVKSYAGSSTDRGKFNHDSNAQDISVMTLSFNIR